MRFSTTNLCTEDATVVTASSANPNFPVSNLKNPLRAKRWRSSGTFIIDNLRNKINFKESALGSELTATIPDATYTSTTLAAAVKAALEAVSVDTFTVTYSSTTGLWTIVSDGTYFQMLNLTGSNVGVSLAVNVLGFAQADTDGATTQTGSRIAIHTMESVVFDLRTAQDIQNICIMWPKEDGIKLSSSASIKIEANATNVWTAPTVSQTLTISNDYVKASHAFATSQSYRYWRVTIQDSENPYLYVELGMVWIGEDLGIQAPENGFDPKIIDPTVNTETPFGQVYSDEYPQRDSLEIDYKVMDYTDYQILEAAYRRNGNRKPVLIILDNEEIVFDRDHFLLYGLMGKDFGGKHVSYNLFNTGLKITELG